MRLAACKQQRNRSSQASSPPPVPQLSPPSATQPGRIRRRAGFSLIEIAVAVPIIGLGVAAAVTVSSACTQATGGGRRLTQAVFLAENIREWSLVLPMTDPDAAEAGNPPGTDPSDTPGVPDDLDDLLDVTFDPPRDGQGRPVDDQSSGWSQHVTLTWVNPNTLSPVPDGASQTVQVQVQVRFQGQPVFTTTWLVTGR